MERFFRSSRSSRWPGVNDAMPAHVVDRVTAMLAGLTAVPVGGTVRPDPKATWTTCCKSPSLALARRRERGCELRARPLAQLAPLPNRPAACLDGADLQLVATASAFAELDPADARPACVDGGCTRDRLLPAGAGPTGFAVEVLGCGLK